MSIINTVAEANRNLLRNKMRSFLTILAIFIGSFTIILNQAINTGVNDYIDKQVESTGAENYLEIMSTATTETMTSMMSGEIKEYNEEEQSLDSTSISEKQAEKARNIEGVESLDLFRLAQAEWIRLDGTETKYRLNSINMRPRGDINYDMLAGRAPMSDSDNYEIMITEDFAKIFGYEEREEDIIGKKVTIAAPMTHRCSVTLTNHKDCLEQLEATIVGVQAPSITAMGGNCVNISLWNKISDINQTDIPKENQSFMMATAVVDPERIDEIKEEMKELGLTAMSINDEVGMIRSFFDAILVVFDVFGGIALLAAAIGIVNTLLMSVQERTREIGLDKALGMSNGKIFLSFSLEAIMLGFWGSLVGIGFSMLAGSVINKVAASSFLKNLPTFTLAIFDWKKMVAIIVVIMFIAFIAGTLPARKASKKNPIDSLRYE